MTDLPPPQWPPPEPATPQPPPPYAGQYPPPYAAPYPAPPYQPEYPPQPQSGSDGELKVDGLAIAALVFGIIGGVLLSVGFAVAALIGIARGTRRGKGLAIGGLVLSAVWLVAFAVILALVVGGQDRPHRAANGTVTTAGHLSPFKLRTGDCVRLPNEASSLPTSLSVVPCSDPHNGEVFARVPASDLQFYPSEEAVRQGSLSRCQDAANTFLGSQGGQLSIVALYPDSAQWDTETKLSTCLLVDEAADFTGSVRDHAA